MRQLYVLRHGIAVPHGSIDYEEDERPLTPKGRKRMTEVARGLRRLDVAPDRILSSPLPRARQTAEIVAGVLKLDDRLELADELRPHHSSASIKGWLDILPGDSVMIVGHDPSFSDLISTLLLGPNAPPITSLRKGGIACFEVDPIGAYHLDWLATPGLIRHLAGKN